eukprot:Clim_evm23s211 gene=Clim_evmTU23s211
MAEDGDNWCLIESDPGLFTKLVQDVGVKGVQVEELHSLDAITLQQLSPIYGLIFLFKWREEDAAGPLVEASDKGIFFARQIITNACATQAILSVLMNQEDTVELGDTLKEFKLFTSEFDPEMKGLAISNSDVIRSVHNSFSRTDMYLLEHKDHGPKDDDVFHFVAYIPGKDGNVYELDGLRSSPIDHGSASGRAWYEHAAEVIQQRITRYAASEIRFNLLAITKDRLVSLGEQIGQVREAMTGAAESEIDEQLADLKVEVAQEEAKRAQWAKENARRQHNFMPLILETLKVLAEKHELGDRVKQAREKAQARHAARQAGKGGQ